MLNNFEPLTDNQLKTRFQPAFDHAKTHLRNLSIQTVEKLISDFRKEMQKSKLQLSNLEQDINTRKLFVRPINFIWCS